MILNSLLLRMSEACSTTAVPRFTSKELDVVITGSIFCDGKWCRTRVNRCYLLSRSLSSSLGWRKAGRLAHVAVLTSQVIFWSRNGCSVVCSDHSDKPLDQCIQPIFKCKRFYLYFRKSNSDTVLIFLKFQYVTYGNNCNFILILIFYCLASVTLPVI